MKLTTLESLFIEELKDLYDCEKQITRALPKLAKAASSDELTDALNAHLVQTREHVTRLERVFEAVGRAPARKKCEGVAGLLEEGNEVIEQKADPAVKDAALIAAAQRVEHYEMAGYGCARTWAELLGHDQAAAMLQETLDEEKTADEKLTSVSESINRDALSQSRAEKAEYDGKERPEIRQRAVRSQGRANPARKGATARTSGHRNRG